MTSLIPKVPEIDLQSLLSATLAHVSTGGTFEAVDRRLGQAHLVNGRWQCLKNNLNDQKVPEKKVFRFLETIFQRVLSVAGVSEPLAHLTVAGSTTSLYQRTNRTHSIGRGTRVWRVQNLKELRCPSRPEYALKDTWIHDDRPTRHETILKIKRAQPAYGKCFLAFLDAGFALADWENSQPDNARQTIRRRHGFVLTSQGFRLRASETVNRSTLETSGPLGTLGLLQTSGPSVKSRKSGESRQSGRSGGLGTSGTTGQSTSASQYTPIASKGGYWDYSKSNIFPRQHYRIIFEEIGTPIHYLRNYKDIITAIKGASEGLHAIHLTGHVHRDVSSGNILLVKQMKGEGDLGKIIDLEYVKVLEKESNLRDVKMGTYEFMATEVAEIAYMHAPPENTFLRAPKEPILPPFCQNQFHDLESVWWVCMWMVLRTFGPLDTSTRQFLDDYRHVFDNHQARHSFLTNAVLFRKYTVHIAERNIPNAMLFWRNHLNKGYGDAYAKNQFGNVRMDILDGVRKTQKDVLDVISKTTADYPPDLLHLSDLRVMEDLLKEMKS
ncbi:kinase domain protein [Ceratobasidium sp. AG-Ba]|nr:kinase domain protein [Ceratobasidium sp. AG-Ba]